jgi:hypothetical protein
MSRSLMAFVAVLALNGGGCNDRPPSGPIPVHPVNGQILYKGAPVPSALVIFHPAKEPAAAASKPGDEAPPGPPRPLGKTDAEGKFRLHTYVGDDGAPTGDYKVTVVLSGSGETRNVMTKEVSKALKGTLPVRYSDPKTTDLSAQVKEGVNELAAFELK